MRHLIQVIAENPSKKALLASEMKTVRVPQWPEYSALIVMKGGLDNVPGFAEYIPDSWMKPGPHRGAPMPPDRTYLIQIIGTLAGLWLKKSVTTATLMRQGQEQPDVLPDRDDEYKISQEWIEQFIACPYRNCK